jgi:hypothetical protein
MYDQNNATSFLTSLTKALEKNERVLYYTYARIYKYSWKKDKVIKSWSHVRTCKRQLATNGGARMSRYGPLLLSYNIIIYRSEANVGR